MEKSLDQMRYEYALARVEELLPLVSDATPVNDPLAMELAKEVGVSPSRISDYVSGRAEPTLKVARLLCATLGIAPALLLGV